MVSASTVVIGVHLCLARVGVGGIAGTAGCVVGCLDRSGECMDIIPFNCSQCGADFIKEEGGICARCNKPFCRDHLYMVKDNKKIIFLCLDDKGDMPGKKIKYDLLFIRRFLASRQKE